MKWIYGLVVAVVVAVVLAIGAVGGVWVHDTYTNYQTVQQNLGLVLQVIGQNIQQGHLTALQPPSPPVAAPAAPSAAAPTPAPAPPKDAPPKK